jgi:hypothetical protein
MWAGCAGLRAREAARVVDNGWSSAGPSARLQVSSAHLLDGCKNAKLHRAARGVQGTHEAVKRAVCLGVAEEAEEHGLRLSTHGGADAAELPSLAEMGPMKDTLSELHECLVQCRCAAWRPHVPRTGPAGLQTARERPVLRRASGVQRAPEAQPGGSQKEHEGSVTQSSRVGAQQSCPCCSRPATRSPLRRRSEAPAGPLRTPRPRPCQGRLSAGAPGGPAGQQAGQRLSSRGDLLQG